MMIGIGMPSIQSKMERPIAISFVIVRFANGPCGSKVAQIACNLERVRPLMSR